jgi:hypothetical protein
MKKRHMFSSRAFSLLGAATRRLGIRASRLGLHESSVGRFISLAIERACLFLPACYRAGAQVEITYSQMGHDSSLLPDVDRFAAQLYMTGKFEKIVYVGCAAGAVVTKEVAPDNIVYVERSLEDGLPLDLADWDRCLVVCSGILERLADPVPLLRSLSEIQKKAPFVLISVSDRTRTRGMVSLDPPVSSAVRREWSIDEFARLLASFGIQAHLIGHTTAAVEQPWKSAVLAIGGAHSAPALDEPQVSVLAIVSTYNDADIIGSVSRYLISQGVKLWFVDNWSTDGTFELLQKLRREMPESVVGIERIPVDAPSDQYEWASILQRKDDIGAQSEFDWIIHYDSDEIRATPWRNVSLAQGISYVDKLGYNAIDHTVIDFRPTVDGFSDEHLPQHFFNFFDFGKRNGHFVQIKAWKRMVGGARLKDSGGHKVAFADMRVFPLKFLLKHYSLRSVAHAKRKILKERLPRFEEEKRKYGWHIQYDAFAQAGDDSFLWKSSELLAFNEVQFNSEFLLERLSGIGIPRTSEMAKPRA